MVLRCCDINTLRERIIEEQCPILMFGAGVIGQISTLEVLYENGLLAYIDCFIDNCESKWGTTFEAYGRTFVIYPPEYINTCSNNKTVILLNISRFSSVIEQLLNMQGTKEKECYLMPMMMIHNYCMSKSCGVPKTYDHPIIPKKLHYMWLGGKTIPKKLEKCIDSWKRYCPDYEIVEWNENNYDINKHIYMKQAYDAEAYGFVPDYARLDILYNEGGFYLDTDVELKRNIDALRFQQAFCGVEKWQILNFGGLSGAVKGNAMIKAFLDARNDLTFYNEDGSQNRNTCGYYDTKVALKYGYKVNGKTQIINGMNIYAYDFFHPYDYMSGMLSITENTYSVHWFNGGWLDEEKKKSNEESKRIYLDLYNKAIDDESIGS